MAPLAVDKISMYSNRALRAAARVSHAASCTNSTFTVAKKLSATALSQQLPGQHIGRDGKRVARVGRHPEASAPPSGEAALAHQPRHALATRPMAAVDELRMDPRTAVPLPALRVDRGDLEAEAVVGLGVRRR